MGDMHEHDQHTDAAKVVLSVQVEETSEGSTVVEQSFMHAMQHGTSAGDEVTSPVSHADGATHHHNSPLSDPAASLYANHAFANHTTDAQQNSTANASGENGEGTSSHAVLSGKCSRGTSGVKCNPRHMTDKAATSAIGVVATTPTATSPTARTPRTPQHALQQSSVVAPSAQTPFSISPHTRSYQPVTPPPMDDPAIKQERHASSALGDSYPPPSSRPRIEVQELHTCATGAATGTSKGSPALDSGSSDSAGVGLLGVHGEAAAANAWLVKHLKTAPVRVKRSVLEALRAFHSDESLAAVAAHLPKEWSPQIKQGVLVVIEQTAVGSSRSFGSSSF